MTTASAIKERPILFSAEMVRAILEGRKTQTRRIVNLSKLGFDSPQPSEHATWAKFIDGVGWEWWGPLDDNHYGLLYQHSVPCPYGKPGDRLWVRETLNILDWDDSEARLGAFVEYAANREPRGWTHDVPGVSMDWGKPKSEVRPDREEPVRVIPSMFMPRWASRITLELTDVRVERLQEISEEDARAEGAQVPGVIYPDSPHEAYSYRENLKLIWESINGAGSWAANSWVWCLTFKRILA